MEFRKLGKSSLNASVIGFGAWEISGDLGKVNTYEMIKVIKEAYSCGINFFDTAPAYGVESSGMKGLDTSEIILGKALKGIRDKVIIATKFGIVYGKLIYNSSRKSIKKEIDASLKRLKTDYIDLYQAHWPDFRTPIEETFSTLNKFKKSGKIRFVGVCNYSVTMIEEALKYCDIISSQNLYNMIQRNSDSFYKSGLIYRTESEILPFCEKNNIGFIPFSPFCQGLLTGQKLEIKDNDFRKSNPELYGKKLLENFELVQKLSKISIKIGKPLSQVVLNWLIKDKRITTIIAGPRKISEVIDNIESCSWSLDEVTYKEINSLLRSF